MCGIGGGTRGFLDGGIRILRGIDKDKNCQKTYEENNKPAKFLHKNILDLTSDELLSGIDRENDSKFAIIACAPCQPFSRAGVQDPEDIRTSSILAVNKFIYDIKPDFVFVENVPGFMKFYPEIYEQFLEPYNEMNYHYDCDVVNLRVYGVPQNRRRYLFLASRDYEIQLPEPTHGSGLLPFVTVRNVIEPFSLLEPNEYHRGAPNHDCYNLTEKTINRLKHTPSDGGSWKDWPEELILDCHKERKGHYDVYGRMRWDEPGPTITCRSINVSNGRFAHPIHNRGISVREAAALQTFSNNFIFYESLTASARYIGNAVPPIVAKKIAEKIICTI